MPALMAWLFKDISQVLQDVLSEDITEALRSCSLGTGTPRPPTSRQRLTK